MTITSIQSPPILDVTASRSAAMKRGPLRGRLGAMRIAALMFATALHAPARAAAPVELQAICAAALPLPADQLNLPSIEQELLRAEAVGGEITLDLACRGWLANLRLPGGDAAAALSWQAQVAQVLANTQRLAEARDLAQATYDPALALGPNGRMAARRAAAAMGSSYMAERDQANTLLWTQRAVDANLSGQPLDTEGAMVLANRASADLMRGRFQEAERQLSALLSDMRVASSDQLAAFAYPAAVTLNQLVYAQGAQARWADALATSQQLVAHRRLHLPQDRAGLAVALGTQGTLVFNMARYDDAQVLMQAALDEARGGGSSDANASGGLQQVRANLADLLLARGQPQQALALAQEAAAQTRGGAQLNALHIVANAHTALGDLPAAVATWREALAIVQIDPPSGEAWLRLRSLLGHAQAMLILGDRVEARRLLDMAQTEADRAPPNLNEGVLRLQAEAVLAEQQGQPVQALRAIEQADALAAASLVPEHPRRLDLFIRACRLGRGCDTLPARLSAAGVFPRLVAAGALALARERLAAGDGPGAQSQATLALNAALAAAQPLLQWQAMAEYARSQMLQGRRVESIFFGKLAVAQLQQTRSRLAGLGADADALYLADKLQVYRELASWLFDAGRLPEGLEVLRLLKGSEQDDFNERAVPPASGEISLTAQEQDWRRRLEAATADGRDTAADIRRLSALQAARRITPDELARLNALLAEQTAQSPAARQQLGRVLAELQAAATAAGVAAPAIDARSLRLPQPADRHTLHVYLLVGPDRLRAALVGQRGTRLLQGSVTQQALTAQIATLLDAVRQRQDARVPAQALYRHLGPLLDAPARAWGIRRLVVWLDGPLRYLPLGLLHDGQRFLVERYAISVATPVGQPVATAARARQPLRVQAWGVTQALAGLPALPGVGQEMCGIVDGPVRGLQGSGGADQDACRGALPGQGDANARFTEAAWRAAGQTNAPGGVVHVGTHFVLRPGNVSHSWLLLGDGSRLMLAGLRGWPLGAPRLVTLSACETAVPGGTDADGREVDGLAGTLLGSGAAQVVASLWRVDDQATAALMQRLYTHAARHPADMAWALQQTQTEALRRGAPPHVWAAFTISVPAAR